MISPDRGVDESGPLLAVIVSTIGRPAAFRRLMESLADCPIAERLELVVVDQSDDQRCAAVLAERDWRVPARATTSARGASIGRNTGLRLSTAPLVAFPDDDAWYPPETLSRVVELLTAAPSLGGVCGRQLTADGRASMLRWQETAGVVTTANFLRTSIMSTMFFQRSALEAVGEFDENMGVGSPGWYGACEESDLLLRVIESGRTVPYEPSLIVYQDEPRDDPDEKFVAKMLSYGCGQGHLWRKRRLSRGLLAWYLARKVVGSAVRASRGQRVLARADLAWIRGTVAGLRDVPPRHAGGTP